MANRCFSLVALCAAPLIACTSPPLPPGGDAGANAADLAIAAPAAPTCLRVSPVPMDCGGSRVGFQVAPLSFVVENRCASELTISRVDLAGPELGDFALELGMWKPPVKLPGGTNVSYVLDFTPGALGVRRVNVIVDSDDATAPTWSVPANGTGH